MEAKNSKAASTRSSWHFCRWRPMRQDNPYKHHNKRPPPVRYCTTQILYTYEIQWKENTQHQPKDRQNGEEQVRRDWWNCYLNYDLWFYAFNQFPWNRQKQPQGTLKWGVALNLHKRQKGLVHGTNDHVPELSCESLWWCCNSKLLHPADIKHDETSVRECSLFNLGSIHAIPQLTNNAQWRSHALCLQGLTPDHHQ